MKKTKKSIIMLICVISLLAVTTISVFALNPIIYFNENGESVSTMAAAACCSKPNIADYALAKHTPKQGICIFTVRKYCHNCGYTLDSTVTVENGHGAWICSLPIW